MSSKKTALMRNHQICSRSRKNDVGIAKKKREKFIPMTTTISFQQIGNGELKAWPAAIAANGKQRHQKGSSTRTQERNLTTDWWPGNLPTQVAARFLTHVAHVMWKKGSNNHKKGIVHYTNFVILKKEMVWKIHAHLFNPSN